MNSFVLSLREVDKTYIGAVGGKSANIGELFKIEGINVPEGFCVSTEAFKIIIQQPSISDLLEKLSRLHINDTNEITDLSRRVRIIIEGLTIPETIIKQIIDQLNLFGEENAYAIRSSATAEDLPEASFAGQQDSYLNITGKKSVLAHISKCWASLYTERAVIYRKQNGYDERNVYLSVIVQKMVAAEVSGIMFTADPVTNNRKVISIDAAFGFGDKIVSGRVSPDLYKVAGAEILSKNLATETLAGATLKDDQILTLAGIGRKIEKHFGYPQDIEWCLADDKFYIVQSRPVTTLYPVPDANDDGNHVYISVGHQQMMTDAMKPLGLSFWKLTAGRPMYEAGGRLFVDVANELASPVKRDILLNLFGKSEPLIRDALVTIVQRSTKEYIPDKNDQSLPLSRYDTLMDYDTTIVTDLIANSEASLTDLKEKIEKKSGVDLINFIFEDLDQLKKSLSNPQSFGVFMTAMNASSWINEKIYDWLGEKNVADTLSQSVPNNITSEMGLALLDVADAIRPYPDVINYMQNVKNDGFLNDLVNFNGGSESKKAVDDYLEKYGMRCVGEIDITKTRWSEKPAILFPLILSNIKSFASGESKRRFEKGQREALRKEEELLARIKNLPDGEEKARETKRMIDLVRNLIGYREYPKYSIVSRYCVYKKSLLKEAERLVQANVLQDKKDIFYLTLEELREGIYNNKSNAHLIDKRKKEFKSFEKLNPPRVMTSDGEIVTGEYKRANLPADAIVGLPVSSGVIEGRARIILNVENASLEEGDILVTSFTDPSCTPLFVLIKGLVTEVGGLMTHGAVIAREYGLPAVVGVQNATNLIKDGQWIRVNGTEGYVELMNN
jgi:pyruvate,water dikinase